MANTSKTRFHVRTPKARENQLINLAVDLAERQLRDGSATAQVITHFLKLATTKEQLENDKLRADLDLATAKIKQIESQQEIKEMYGKALAAMKSYQGIVDGDEEDEDFYD